MWVDVRKEEPAYDRLVREADGRMLYHHPQWLAMIGKVTGAELRYVVAGTGKESTAALPFFVSTDRGGGRVINSSPFFGSIGGILTAGDPGNVTGPLLEALDGFARSNDILSATIITNPVGQDDCIGRDWNPDRTLDRISQVTPIPATVEDLDAMLHDSKRRNVRSAMNKGVTVRPVQDGDWDWFIGTHVASMEALNGLPKPMEFFDAIRAMLGGDAGMRVLIAEHDGVPCAGLVYSMGGACGEYLVPVYDPDKSSLFGLQLVIHEAMLQCVEEGIPHWNFGGTWASQEGLYRFKKQWAARDFEYEYHIKVYDERLLAMDVQDITRFFPWFFCYPFSG